MEDASTQAQVADRQSKLQQARALSRRSDYAFHNFKRIKQSGDEEDNSEAVRKATLLSNRQIMAFFNDKPDQTQEVADQQKQESAINKQATESRLSIIKQALLKKMIIEAQEKKEEDAAMEEDDNPQLLSKTQAKAAMRRGAIYIANSIAGALDLSTAGISLLITAIMYIFTFGWLNLEMIYGRHLAKGKSRFVPPISWAPIPMPVDKYVIILQGFILAADVILGIAFFIMGAGGICLLHDFGKLVASPSGAGVILASGGEGMCLGGIMSMILNGL